MQKGPLAFGQAGNLASPPVLVFYSFEVPRIQGLPRVTTLIEDRFLALSSRKSKATTVPQLVSDRFAAIGTRISATTVRRCLQNQGLYARRPFVCVVLNDDREVPIYTWQEGLSPGSESNGPLYSSQMSLYLLWKVIQVVC
ncbi:hypothetical protein AVEN_18404-1 [Araneus ventricosus]|uniref:Transposase Tc1-like domain-containing protein n=1 Tax=Araneus ventricosus TaxID=182803 RepID=A0A4Y2VNA6_ARAVE|nr:hypothetical protein AVEN_18404-1 [Araneus ventricosus]